MGLRGWISICTALCPHTVNEWVHCPAAGFSPLSAIQVDNWLLIECFRREEKQWKQMRTLNKTLGACSKFNRFNTCHRTTVSVYHQAMYISLAKVDMTSLVYAAIIHSPSLSPLVCLLWLICPHTFLYIFLPSLYYPPLYSSASNFSVSIPLPQIPLCYLILSASVVHILVLSHLSLSFSPSSHFCMQVTRAVGEAAQQYKREQKRKGHNE